MPRFALKLSRNIVRVGPKFTINAVSAGCITMISTQRWNMNSIYMARLSREERLTRVIAMKVLYELGHTYREIGEAFDVSHMTAWRNINGESYPTGPRL